MRLPIFISTSVRISNVNEKDKKQKAQKKVQYAKRNETEANKNKKNIYFLHHCWLLLLVCMNVVCMLHMYKMYIIEYRRQQKVNKSYFDVTGMGMGLCECVCCLVSRFWAERKLIIGLFLYSYDSWWILSELLCNNFVFSVKSTIALVLVPLHFPSLCNCVPSQFCSFFLSRFS